MTPRFSPNNTFSNSFKQEFNLEISNCKFNTRQQKKEYEIKSDAVKIAILSKFSCLPNIDESKK